MQVTLNIDSANIGGTVEQVFETLSLEDKKDLAKQVMLEVLSKPQGAERRVYENAVIKQLMEETKNESGNWKLDTEEKVRSSYKFRDHMQKYKSSSDRMMETILSQTLQFYKDMVTDLVSKDPQTHEMIETVRNQFVADMPNVLQNVMATYFATQMSGISTALLQSMNSHNAIGVLAQNIQGQLSTQGIQVQLGR